MVYAIAINGCDHVNAVVISSEALVSRSQGELDSLEGSSIPHGSVTYICGVAAKLVPWIEYGSAFSLSLYVNEELAPRVCLTSRYGKGNCTMHWEYLGNLISTAEGL